MLVTKKAEIKGETVPVLSLERPEKEAVPFLFNSPHSGSHYPKHFLQLSRLDALTLRKTEDAFVNELFEDVVQYGAVFVQALFPRSYVDLNREPYELDRRLLAGTMPDYANTTSLRVRNGLGTVARLVSEYEAIYRKSLPLETVLERIALLYKPYHAELVEAMDEIYQEWGMAVLVDCHSMPSITSLGQVSPQPDIVIGDRYGASCDKDITGCLQESLAGRGYRVVLNKPYAGGFITENYGAPDTGRHAVQIEINRKIYMDEDRMEKTANFSVLQADLELSMQEVMALVTDNILVRKCAAE